jgi:hypothetical protein
MKYKQRDFVVCNQSFPKSMKHEIQFWTKTHGRISLVPSLCMLQLFVPTKTLLWFIHVYLFMCVLRFKIQKEKEKKIMSM